VTDLIRRAGGLLPTAYVGAAVFTRVKDDAGRIALDLAQAMDRPGERSDLVLEKDDVLLVPQAPHTVKVVGEVGFPASVLFRKGKGVSYYLSRAGGLTRDADEDRIMVQRASGEIEHGKGGFLSSGPKVDAGTVIIVPRKEPKPDGSRLRDLADIVNVMAGAATTIFLIHEVTQ
jgi:protein involved in polysaccharide export with SLBB domain